MNRQVKGYLIAMMLVGLFTDLTMCRAWFQVLTGPRQETMGVGTVTAPHPAPACR